jgi:hypothetical protein
LPHSSCPCRVAPSKPPMSITPAHGCLLWCWLVPERRGTNSRLRVGLRPQRRAAHARVRRRLLTLRASSPSGWSLNTYSLVRRAPRPPRAYLPALDLSAPISAMVPSRVRTTLPCLVVHSPTPPRIIIQPRPSCPVILSAGLLHEGR